MRSASNVKYTATEKLDDRSPNAFLNDRKLERIVDEPSEDGINLRFEADTQADALALVSECGLENLELGFDETSSRHIQRAVRRRARSSSRISDHGRDVSSPRLCAARRSATTWRCQSGYWHVLRMLGEVIQSA